MKSTALLPLAAAAAAFAIPDAATAQQLVLEPGRHDASTASSWWDGASSSSYLDGLRSSIEEAIHDDDDDAADSLERAASHVHDLVDQLDIEPDVGALFDDDDEDAGADGPRHRLGNLTIYQAISRSKYTTKFAKLVDGHEDVVALLNSTEANSTVFVPTDAAFARMPHHGDEPPPRDLVEKLLRYHVVPGLYPAGRVLAQYTLPTALEEEGLGSRAQRLRVGLGLGGVRVNFYSKVTMIDLVRPPPLPLPPPPPPPP